MLGLARNKQITWVSLMWPDRAAARVMAALRDQFRVTTLIETGTAHGIGARYWSRLFPVVFSCDIDRDILAVAKLKVRGANAFLYCCPSPDFLAWFRRDYEMVRRQDYVVFLLDAHWYQEWPLLDELRALKGFLQAIIVIHDFKAPGLGYVSYGGQDLDWDYVKTDLMAVNPGFHFYHNTHEGCDIVTPAEVKAGRVPGLVWDKETQHVLEKIVWESDRRAYRGILYATPEPLEMGGCLPLSLQRIQGCPKRFL